MQLSFTRIDQRVGDTLVTNRACPGSGRSRPTDR